MAKERDWIGYANLASNLTQNMQLRHANQTLEELHRAATASALNEQEARQTDEHEARLREHVFQLADNVEGLHRHLHELPCAALVLALEIEAILEKNNVSTASFRAWEDKDRLKKVVKGLEDVREKASALLEIDGKEKAARCVKYHAEMPALDQLISVQSKKEKFQREREKLESSLDTDRKRVEIEIAKLKSEQSGIQLPAWARACFAVGGLGVAFSAFWFVVYVMSASMSDPNMDTVPQQSLPVFILLSAPGGVVLAVFVLSVAAIVAAFLEPANRRHAELAGKITSLNAEIASAKAELAQFDLKSPIRQNPTGIYADPCGRNYEREREEIAIQRGDPSPEWATQTRLEELYAMFGNDLPSEAYAKIKRERVAFINKVFGKSDESDIINDSPPSSEQDTTPKLGEKWET